MVFSFSKSTQSCLAAVTLFLISAGCGSSENTPKALDAVTNSIGMTFLIVPPGEFQMGSNQGDPRERPIHEVVITNSYGLGATEVTEGQFSAVMGKDRKLTMPASAINSLTWKQAKEFCQRLSDLPAEKAAGRNYRLPTEAEWEYACRAGTDSAYSFGDDATLVTQHGWYGRNSGDEAHPPSQKIPNPWGFSDMHGNAWEWCDNWLYDYPDSSVTDPTGPESGKTHVLRGGSFFHLEPNCRSSSRFYEDPNSLKKFTGGFRVAFISE
nr:formylglycine-generating enzyme family protein [Rubripirellula sp.]